MRIFCVVGGSYKTIYLNYLTKIGRCNLLIFNFGVFHELRGDFKTSEVAVELLELSKSFNCFVLAGIKLNGKDKFVVCKKRLFLTRL